MADFFIQFLEGVIPGLDADVDVNAPPLFGIQDFTKAFLIPAAYPQITAGVGRATGGQQNDTLNNVTTRAQLVDIDTVRFTDGTAASSFDNLVGAHVLEYRGATGGPNEVIVRAVAIMSGSGTVIDSTPITGIADLNDVVPFAFVQGNINNGNWTSHSCKVEVVVAGSDTLVRATKSNGTDTVNLVVYVVEFVGSNWKVQKVTHDFAVGNTDEDNAISSVGSVSNAFIYSTPLFTDNRPDRCLYYAWLASNTTVRHRIRTLTGATSVISYVISNPQLRVTVYGADPDGTSDLAATGVHPETRNVAVTAVSSLSQAMVLGFAGSDHTTAGNRPSVATMMHLSSTTNVRLRRSDSTGGTEYKIQVIDFSAVEGSFISDFTPITDGESFTINGSFGATPTVEINGVSQNVDASDDTSILVTAVLGDNRYGVDYGLVVTDGAQVLTAPNANFNAPATKQYVNLTPPLAPSANRLTTSPDLGGFEQIEYSQALGGGITDVIVYIDGAFSVAPGISAFYFRAHDGVSWGTLAIQEVSAPVPPKTKALSCPIPTPL